MTVPLNLINRSLQTGQPAQPQLPIAGAPPTPGFDRVKYYQMMGMTPPGDPDEDESGFLRTAASGVLAGVVDPFGFIPGVGDFVETLKKEQGDGFFDNPEYALGYMVGAALPLAPALRLGSWAARGLGLVRAGKAAQELTHVGRLTRGAIAGALVTVGQDVESTEQRIKNTLVNGALFGVGDLAIDPLVRMVAGSSIWRPFKQTNEEIIEIAQEIIRTGSVQTNADASIMGRALQLIDEFHPPNVDGPSLAKRKLNLQLGIEQMGLKDLQPGQIKVVPAVTEGDLPGMKSILDRLGVKYAFSKHKVGDKTVLDALVSQDDIPQEILRSFNATGIPQGLEVLWQGRKLVVSKTAEKGTKVLAFDPTSPKRELIPVPRNELQPLSMIQPVLKDVPGAPKLWAEFTRKYGIHPLMDTPEGPKGFSELFDEFTKSFSPQDKMSLKKYFLERQRDVVKQIDPELAAVISKDRSYTGPHPEGPLAEAAAQRGFLLTREPLGTIGADGRTQWGVGLRRLKDGETITFETREAADEFLKSHKIDMPEMVGMSGSPLDPNVVTGGVNGVGVQVPHTAGELSNANLPFGLAIRKRFQPRGDWIRDAENWGIKTQGDAFPRIWSGAFAELIRANTVARNHMDQYFRSLSKARGGVFSRFSPRVRGDKYDDFNEIFMRPREQWAGAAQKAGLTPQEVAVAGELRKVYDDMFDELAKHSNVKISGSEFVEDYMPHIWRRSQEDVKKSLQAEFARRGKKLDESVLGFVESMERSGVVTKWERDPFINAARYVRATMFKSHAQDAYMNASTIVQQLKGKEGLKPIYDNLQDFLSMAHGGVPEAFHTVRVALNGVLKDQLDLELQPKDIDRLTQTLMTLNYGAFMGFRPGLAVRNATQIFVTLLPTVGSKYTAHGVKQALWNRDALAKEMLEEGFMSRGLVPIPGGEFIAGAGAGTKAKATGKALATAGTATEVLQKWAQIGGKMFQYADDFTRMAAYAAQKQRTYDALVKYRPMGSRPGHMDIDRFNDESGLSVLGEAATREFHNILRQDERKAIKWLAGQVTGDSMFLYQLGAGPQIFSHGAGKLLGMYGTWPTWYGAMMKRGLTRGTAKDKMRFVGWTAAVHVGFAAAATQSGINLNRWTGISSFRYAGGPFLDMGKDALNMWGGKTDAGEPTAMAQISAGKYGLEYNPNTTMAPLGLDPRDERGMDIGDPMGFILGTIGKVTPGAYAAKDIYAATQAPTTREALIRLANLQPLTVGYSSPQIVVR